MAHAMQLEERGARFAIMVLYEGHPTFKLVGWVSPLEPDGPTQWAAYVGRSTRVIRQTKSGAATAFIYEHVL